LYGLLVFNEGTPQWDKYMFSNVLQYVQLRNIMELVKVHGEYHPSRGNRQFTVGVASGVATTDECPFTRVMKPCLKPCDLLADAAMALTCVLGICRIFEEGDGQSLAFDLVHFPVRALRYVPYLWARLCKIDAVSAVVYDAPNRDRNTGSPTLRSATNGNGNEDPSGGAHYDRQNDPVLDIMICYSDYLLDVEEYKRVCAIGINRKSALDSWKLMTAVLYFMVLPKLYFDSIRESLRTHLNGYCAVAKGYWCDFCTIGQSCIIYGLLFAEKLSSFKPLDINEGYSYVIWLLSEKYDLNVLEQLELHVIPLYSVVIWQQVLVGLIWLHYGIPDTTSEKGHTRHLGLEMMGDCKRIFGSFGEGSVHRCQRSIHSLEKYQLQKVMHLSLVLNEFRGEGRRIPGSRQKEGV